MANGSGPGSDSSSDPIMTSSPAGSSVQPCGSPPPAGSEQTISPDKKSWISIKLVDQDDHVVPGEPFRIKLPDGSSVEGQLDLGGQARISGIDPGNCQVSFPNRTASDWKKK